MSSKADVQGKSIAPTTDAPRTAIRDAVLADVSATIDDPEMIEALLWIVEEDCATATITGPSMLVDFADYSEVAL